MAEVESLPPGSPPPTKVGEPPDESWVEDNIVRLLQIKSETEFLEELQEFLQQMQIEQLSEPEVMEALIAMLANPPMVPEGLESFELSSNYLMVMAGHMENLINILKQANPELANELNALLSQIQTIAQTMPPTSDQITELNTILSVLNQYAQTLPTPVQAQFAQEVTAMYMDLGPEIQSEISKLQAEANALQSQLDEPDILSQRLGENQQLINDLDNTWLTFVDAMETFVSITKNVPELTKVMDDIKDMEDQLNQDLKNAPMSDVAKATIKKAMRDELLKKLLASDSDDLSIRFYELNEKFNADLNDLFAAIVELKQTLIDPTSMDEKDMLVFKITKIVSNLKEDIENMEEVTNELPISTAYTDQIRSMYPRLYDSLDAMQFTIDQVDALTPLTKKEIDDDADFREDLNVQLMGINESLASLRSFMDDFTEISAEIQQQSQILNLENTITASYLPIYQMEIDGLIASAEAVMRGNPNAIAEMAQYISQLRAMDVSNLSDADIQQLNNISAGINQRVGEMSNFYQAQYWNAQLSMFEGQIALLDEYNGAVSELQDLINSLDEDDPNKMLLQNFLDSAEDKTAAIMQAQSALESGRTYAHDRAFEVSSLPDLVTSILFGKFIPMQEASLEEQVRLLASSNKGAEIGNQLLEDTLEFAGADSNYNFSTYLQKTNDEYAGDYMNMNDELENEKNQTKRDLMAIENAISDIDNYINDVTNDPQLEEDQKQQIIDQLNYDRENLMVAKGQVQDLSNVLNTLTVSRGSDNSHFKVTGDTTSLSHLEDIVSHGDPDKTPMGGLVTIHSQIDGDQKKYSDQSQTQQMMVQKVFTDMQQVYSLVSTILQTLNQSYLTIARGVYK